ncbi:ABC-type transport auxiliary lipoprotein family protein [Nitrospira sp. M1]
MQRMITQYISTLVIGTAVLLGGCVGGPAPQDHFYRLELPPPESSFTSPLLQGTLQITRPWADALTSERHLLYRTATGTAQVHRHAYHHWIDSPTLIIQQQIAQYLRHSGMATHVVTPDLRVKADYRFSCRMTKLERLVDDSPRVIIEMELGLSHMRERETVLLRTYHVEEPTHSYDIAAAIEAYNHALTNILDQFLADTSSLPVARPVTHRP